MRLLSRGVAFLRDFTRPIPDSSLPRVAEHVSTGASLSLATILLTAPGGPGFLGAAVLLGVADSLRSLIVAPLVAAFFVVTNAWTRTRHGGRHHNGVLFATTAGVAAGCALTGWTSGPVMLSVVHLVVALPALIAMFVPWKPIFALHGTVLGIVCTTAGTSLAYGELTWPAPVLVVTAVCVGVSSAIAQQLNRKFWLRFETAKERLLAAERMSNLGRMTAGIAHELKTPLAAIQNSIESARALVAELEQSIGHEDVTADDLRDIARELAVSVEGVGSSAERATSYVGAIRHHGVGGGIPGPQVAFCVADRFAAVSALMSFRLRTSRVRLEIDATDSGAMIFGDPGKFDQVLTNVVANALDACEDSGRGAWVRLSCRAVDGQVIVAVDDDGPGVPPDIAPRIFESLFTTRAEGTGLGLAISRDLVQGELGGRIEYVPSPRGARFEIRCAAAGG